MTRRLPTSTLIEMVDDARARTLAFVADLDDARLMGPKLAIVNPILWEIGHIAWFQEHFILKQLDGLVLRPDADALYDSMRVAHDDRWDLPLPQLPWTKSYGRDVRDAIVARLEGDLASETDSYFYQLVTFHEDMHVEAFTYSRQTLGLPQVSFGRGLGLDRGALRHSSTPTRPSTLDPLLGPWPGDVAVPGGTFRLGAEPDAPFVFDNEKWAHPHTVKPFSIARAPVTNAEFVVFVEAGGYANRALWSDEGWAWLQASSIHLPAYWEGRPGRWQMRQFDQVVELAPHHPVMYVNWYEANAYCVFAHRRLPTELEWEVAAIGAPDPSRQSLAEFKRDWPWGDGVDMASLPDYANLDGSADGLVDVAACASGDSAFGCRQMMGNVWEWTASDFLPYPGFSADAYAEYSQPWFGTRKVLRGGCWATRSRLVTPRYRNFFTPERRDIFAGFRTCAL